MGKGDKKSRRGKINIGSHGVSRPRRKTKVAIPVAEPEVVKVKAEPKPKAEKKAPAKTEEPAVEVAEKPKKVVKKAPAKKTSEEAEGN